MLYSSSGSFSELKALQKQELEILCELRRICTKYELTYYITAGTLLGAVRHKGFIPWDDDIDIAMPLKDFKKFSRLCRTELAEQYFFQDHRSEKQYPFHFAKIRKNNTIVNDPFLAKLNIHKGLYIDIFPLVKCPRNKNAAKLYFKLIELITYAIIAKYDKDLICGYKKRIVVLCFKILKSMPKSFLISIRDMICNITELFCSKERVCTVSGAHGYPREAFRRDWFEKSVLLSFEGEEFCAPSGWNEFLVNMYGDYMTPPEENEKVGHFI